MRPAKPQEIPKPPSPARDRILKAAETLFNEHGFSVPIELVAQFAQTNTPTINKYFGSRDGLVRVCLLKLDPIKSWQEYEQDDPDDPRAQIRSWITGRAGIAEAGTWDCFQLERAAAHFMPFHHSMSLRLVRDLKKKELLTVTQKCRDAGYANPDQLAKKLVVLVEGAMMCGIVHGMYGPQTEIEQMAEALFKSHEKTPAAAA